MTSSGWMLPSWWVRQTGCWACTEVRSLVPAEKRRQDVAIGEQANDDESLEQHITVEERATQGSFPHLEFQLGLTIELHPLGAFWTHVTSLPPWVQACSAIAQILALWLVGPCPLKRSSQGEQ